MFGLLWLRLRGRATSVAAGTTLRETFERLGGLWLKVGQLLSLRIDLFPQPFCEELAKLQSRSVGFPTPIARRIIEEDLGGPIEHYFDEFGERPFAVASIGQVYRAKLRDGGRVRRGQGSEAVRAGDVRARHGVRARARPAAAAAAVPPPHALGLGFEELQSVMQGGARLPLRGVVACAGCGSRCKAPQDLRPAALLALLVEARAGDRVHPRRADGGLHQGGRRRPRAAGRLAAREQRRPAARRAGG